MSLLSLFVSLLGLVVLSAFFSGSETGMMAVNRYRLRHLARQKHKTASCVNHMLERPEKLLGIILIGNTFANILASAIATVIAVHLFGDIGVVVATILLTLAVLVFAEITPKTLAALYPQRIAFFAAWPLWALLRVLYPIVWLANTIVKGLLGCFGVQVKRRTLDHLTPEELKTLLNEAGNHIPNDHQAMLTRILDLELMRVEDVMIPRQKISIIDLNDEWESIVNQILTERHGIYPVCRDSLDELEGLLPVHAIIHKIADKEFHKNQLLAAVKEPYFIPENTSLNTQLINFKEAQQRSGLVVDEYGEIQGYLSLEDILEEIVGKFTTKRLATGREVFPETDGSFVVAGSANIRELNRSMGWKFNASGPKTVGGLITEQLEFIPTAGTGLRLNGYPIEVLKVQDNHIKTVRIYPKLREQ